MPHVFVNGVPVSSDPLGCGRSRSHPLARTSPATGWDWRAARSSSGAASRQGLDEAWAVQVPQGEARFRSEHRDVADGKPR
jgi:hypothetical protein